MEHAVQAGNKFSGQILCRIWKALHFLFSHQLNTSSCVEKCTLCTVHISLHSLHSKLDHFYTILGCDNWINYSLRLRVQHSAYSNYYVTITVQSSCDDIYFRRYSTVLITERNCHLKRKHYLATIGF